MDLVLPNFFRQALARVVVAFCLALSLPSVAVAQAPLRIDYPDFWPFFTRDEAGEMTGFFHDVVTEALARLGMRATWHSFPWGRCQENVRSGEADAMITVPTAERLEYSRTHDAPFHLKELVVFTRADHPSRFEVEALASIDDILAAGFSVVTYVGNGWNEVNIRSRGIRTYEVPYLKNVWLMLAQGRADIVIEWPGGAWPDIKAQGLAQEIVQTGVVLESMPFHLLVGRDSPHVDLLPRFNETILEMRHDGTIDSILDTYLDQLRLDQY
ncbi:transporter substrate-binding domain-containing protein [Pseudodesulfovibrio sp. F-1]|uniref:Transporter substrate-binding domain-containing protein n=1 Tax=Pseudodesulfovibrio alkaliphilus TaxID=2661613 RepID=A0A7K1KLD6_9BACT|nr:transporter substrate-binding domain-containing protein [Pseudodesulfovibrio alkaliphilus]